LEADNEVLTSKVESSATSLAAFAGITTLLGKHAVPCGGDHFPGPACTCDGQERPEETIVAHGRKLLDRER
jgi:hypothetical protein